MMEEAFSLYLFLFLPLAEPSEYRLGLPRESFLIPRICPVLLFPGSLRPLQEFVVLRRR